MMKKVYKKGDTFSFVKDMVVAKKDNYPLTDDVLWKLANYRDSHPIWKDCVIDYNMEEQQEYKISDKKFCWVAPIFFHHRGQNGYSPLKDGMGERIKILMTQEEVDIFNENFTEKDYKEINFKAVMDYN